MHNIQSPEYLLNFPKNEILEELSKILSSELFSRTTVLSNFLRFIVEQTLENQTNQLKEYTIAVTGLGKSSDFNPQTDAIVRIHAGRLRRLLHEYYSEAGEESTLRIEVIKGSYIPVFRQQISRTSIAEQTIANLGISKDTLPTEEPQTIYSRSKLTLAVLPFRNLCPENDYQFFVDGFGEELTRIFSTSEDISVVAHFSTLKYAHNFEDTRIIGSDLGVHYLIMGSVKRSSSRIWVSVGLVETMNGTQIWSKNYTHYLEKDLIINIQDQINLDVFGILSGQYGFIVRESTRSLESDQNLQTFDAIMWNYRAQLSHSEADFKLCREALENALQHDPTNVMSMLVLADAYLYSYSLGYNTIQNPVSNAYQLINRALHIAPNSQYGHLIFGWANIYLGRKREALESFDFCLQTDLLSSSDKGALGFGLACAGEYAPSLALLKESLELNPYCPWWFHSGFFFNYFQCNNYSEALKHANKINASKDVFMGPLLKAAAKGQMGLIAEAKQDVDYLTEKLSASSEDLADSLNTFLLDRSLVKKIIDGAIMAGVS